jgi:hypothetical protein
MGNESISPSVIHSPIQTIRTAISQPISSSRHKICTWNSQYIICRWATKHSVGQNMLTINQSVPSLALSWWNGQAGIWSVSSQSVNWSVDEPHRQLAGGSLSLYIDKCSSHSIDWWISQPSNWSVNPRMNKSAGGSVSRLVGGSANRLTAQWIG